MYKRQMHDAGSGIDFDLDQAVKTDNDNPVYYVQYAHARICSILKKDVYKRQVVTLQYQWFCLLVSCFV